MTKRFALSAALITMLLLGVCAFAQKSGGQNNGGKKKASANVAAELDSLTQQLNLTDDQKAKISPILEDQHKKIKDIKKDASVSKEDAKAKSKEIRQSSLQQIRSILTADQQKKLDAMPQTHGKGDKKKSGSKEAK